MAKKRTNSVVSVIGIGASAGGVTALKELIPNLPTGRRFAYVVAQHLDPKHRSMLVDVLERETTLDVKTIIDGDKVLPDTIYVTPADRDCVVSDGKLHLRALDEEIAPRHSIDIMLSSLAESYGERSAGIILSGTGSDGLHGMMAIKTTGGVAIAQDPKTTQYPGMPGSVIDAGLADLVLSPALIGGELEAIMLHSPRIELPGAVALPRKGLDALLTVLSGKSPFDFSQYKESTLARRVERRMAVLKADSLDDYIAAVEKSDNEAGMLLKDMLISVTGFFRDEDTFDVIGDALREIVQRKAPGEDIRIWVPGCATGEEAYSIAILLAEALGERLLSTPVNIFATDVDVAAIAFARQGLYLKSSVKTIPEHLLRKYFIGNDGVYQVGKTIRDMMVFARHDLMRDPPYINLDMVSCRNVLIYFKRPLQERLVPVFHYALNPGGYLVFGTAEGVGKFTDLFQQFVTRAKVYFKIGEQRGPPILPLLSLLPSALRQPAEAAVPHRERAAPFEDLYRNLVTEIYAPPGVLVNGRFEIVHVQGDVTRFVQVSSGDLNLNIVNMAIPPMRLEARMVLRKAQRKRTIIRGHPVEIKDDQGLSRVTPIAIPATAGTSGGGHILLLFEERQVAEPGPDGGRSKPDGDEPRIPELERELAAMREQLQSSIEDLETSNHDLLSINEEYQSTAEELQSANEELQTSNEELQSSNEELLTVNDELTAKSDDLAAANLDIENILNTVLSGVMLLDRDLRVVRYSTSSKQIFDLWPASIGSSLATVGSPFDLTPLSAEMEKAIRSRARVERDLVLGDKIFSVVLVPLGDEKDAMSGLIIAFYDETERRRAEYESRRLAAVVRDSNDAITILDFEGKILAWNLGAERLYGYTQAEALKLTIADLVPDGHGPQALKEIEQLADGETRISTETKRRSKDGREFEIWQTAAVLRDDSGKPVEIAMTERDLSESKHLRAATENAVRANQSKSEFLARMSHDFRTPLNAIIGFSEVIEKEMFGSIDRHRYVEYGEHIHSSGEHLLALVNDILDLSKIEADEFELAEEVLDLRELAEESAATLRLQAEREGIALAVDTAADLPKVTGDRRAIRQILFNLLANAINFTPKGGQITVGGHQDRNGGLNLTVSDTGVGIAKEDIATALEPFGQIPGRLRAKTMGAGLGLPIVKGLTAALGAEFDIASEVANGTTVTIRFGKERLVGPSARRRRQKRK